MYCECAIFFGRTEIGSSFLVAEALHFGLGRIFLITIQLALVVIAIFFTSSNEAGRLSPLQTLGLGILFLIADLLLGRFFFISDCGVDDLFLLVPEPNYCPFAIPGYGMISFAVVMAFKNLRK